MNHGQTITPGINDISGAISAPIVDDNDLLQTQRRATRKKISDRLQRLLDAETARIGKPTGRIGLAVHP